MALQLWNHDLLREVREFWFGLLEGGDEQIVLPSVPNFMRWYKVPDEFLLSCRGRWSPVLEQLRHSGMTTADELLAYLPPQEPIDWISYILLLDQLTRNSYRDPGANCCDACVYTFFDQFALDINLKALEQGVFNEPIIRWNLSYRMWSQLPLSHSEDMTMHEKIPPMHAALTADIEGLLVGLDVEFEDEPDKYRRRAREVIRGRAEEARTALAMHAISEQKHLGNITRFGRFPHRNKSLGRENTPDEDAVLTHGWEASAPPSAQATNT